MPRSRSWIAWVLIGGLGGLLAVWLFPRAFVFSPDHWRLTRQQATEVALERLAALGTLPAEPYVVAELNGSSLIERRLQGRLGTVELDALRASPLADRALEWRVTVYEPGARAGAWSYRATLSPVGTVTSLSRRLSPDEAAPSLGPGAARIRADQLLRDAGYDPAAFDPPEPRRSERQARIDLSLRYTDRQAILGDAVDYGVEVTFAGDQLTGFRPWIDEPENSDIESRLQLVNLTSTFWILAAYLLFPIIAVSFLRGYHAGEIGVRRGVHILAVVLVAGGVLMISSARPATEGLTLGLSRVQTTWAWASQIVILWIAVLAVIAALAWSVGEARCRERWGSKLAAFDALFQRRWNNATVARSSLRGLSAGLGLTALLLAVLVAAQSAGVWCGISFLFGPWWQSSASPGLSLLCMTVVIGSHVDLFTWLYLLPGATRRFGAVAGGTLVALLTGVLFWPPVVVDPVWAAMVLGALKAGAAIALFWRYDLLTALLASLTSAALLPALPFLLADSPALRIQGLIPLAAFALPLVASFRQLPSGPEFQYRYEDVPPHVRRIAERERQRVELETARRIQSSILPDLPPRLAGVELACAYLPASEVGGDFYDALELGDGRLALAMGDVAGHGVSSGLVMAMAKSTLTLQVSVDPGVPAVLETLNHMVCKTAHKRLLTTLCYAVLDPRRSELAYGSAGHIGPYHVDVEGRVTALEAASYPLGVRDPGSFPVRTVQLAPGDRLFLFSDGVVEACREGDGEPFGFDRLEQSLERHAAEGPEGLRDGVLADVARFMGPCPRQDDQTLLVLRLP